jgi:hypothetical protein
VLLLHGVPLFVALGPSIFIYRCALVAHPRSGCRVLVFFFFFSNGIFRLVRFVTCLLTIDFLAIRYPAPMLITLTQLTSP